MQVLADTVFPSLHSIWQKIPQNQFADADVNVNQIEIIGGNFIDFNALPENDSISALRDAIILFGIQGEKWRKDINRTST